jgi:PAS domain S-box-containing protein
MISERFVAQRAQDETRAGWPLGVGASASQASIEYGGLSASPRYDNLPAQDLMPGVTGEARSVGRYEAALADLGSLALRGDVADVARAAVAVLLALSDMDVALVLRRIPERNAFSVETGADGDGWVAPGALVPAEGDSQVDCALRSSTPVIVQNPEFDRGFGPMSLLSEHGVTGGILAAIPGEERPWGLLAGYSTSRASFAEDDLHFVRAVSTTIASAIACRRAQKTLESLIEDSPDPTARFDPELRVEYANTAFTLATGYAARELLGQTFRSLGLMQNQIEAFEALVRTVFRSQREREGDFSFSSPLGERSYHIRLVPELAGEGDVKSVLAIARDVTEYKKADDERACLQRELFERDRRYEELIQQVLAAEQRSSEERADATYCSEVVKQLTARETEILRLVASGLTNRQIAGRLRLSAGTVRNHLGRVFPKIDAVDRTQAAVRAAELGLLAPHEW